MASNKGSFKPGNKTRTQFQEGNLPANMKGGWDSEALVALRLPEAVVKLEEAIQVSIPGGALAVDKYLITLAGREWVKLEQMNGYVDARLGGQWIDKYGRQPSLVRNGTYDKALKAFMGTMAALGISPAARYQLIGNMAAARRDQATVRVQEDLRTRYAPSVQISEPSPPEPDQAGPLD